MKTAIITVSLSVIALYLHPAAASISGSALITVEDYPVFGPHAPHNPPFCGMPYDSLDLSRITAVQGLSHRECGSCLRVCGAVGCANVLAVDRGGIGLDLSTGISESVIGNKDGRGHAAWKRVDKEACNGIWDGRMYGEKKREATEQLEVREAEEGSPVLLVEKALVPILNPTPITTFPISTSLPSSTPLTIATLHTTTFPTNATNATNATTITVVTTIFTSATSTSSTSTTTRITTTPRDAVTYSYSNGVARPQNLLGEVVRRMGWWGWTVLVLLIVGLAEEGGILGWEEERGDAEGLRN
ncbi:MAG: hypothetical protein M1840_008739 [Geoglossum simile]|nr:MAG: hypothetical protein M1840_008739 [Geoglossum simile]